MRSLTLLLVRHGETTWNAEGRWQGQTDVPLSEVGRRQAELLGARLARLFASGALPRPKGVFTSDLSRAVETARLLAEFGGIDATATVLPELRERYFGSWEGKTAEEVGFAPGSGERAPDAEGYDAVWVRMSAALERVWHTSDSAALIVGHGGSLRALVARAGGLDASGIRHFALGNTSLTVATFAGESLETAETRLLRVNDTAHLETCP